MTKVIFITALLVSFFHSTLTAQTDALRLQIAQIIAGKKADVGIAIRLLETGDTISINGSRHYPMQSVFKFHIALAVLDQVDKGKLSLDQIIVTKQSDLMPHTWSPLLKEHPGQDLTLPLHTLLEYAVSQSDNNACDILLKLLGGPVVVNDYLHAKGIKAVAISATENQMHQDWEVQFSNWTTAAAGNQLLTLFYNRKILSEKSTSFLWKIMTATSTGAKRIKGQLPPATVVAHKTGTSATNDKGVTAAVNDIGIITLPNGNHLVISVFVTNSTENEETNEKIIAGIGKAAWAYFSVKNK